MKEPRSNVVGRKPDSDIVCRRARAHGITTNGVDIVVPCHPFASNNAEFVLCGGVRVRVYVDCTIIWHIPREDGKDAVHRCHIDSSNTITGADLPPLRGTLQEMTTL